MSEENNIIVSDALVFSKPNCPTRVGELVESVDDIKNIPTPRLGMQVYVKSEDSTYIITELESVTMNGVATPDAKVKSYKLYDPREVEKSVGKQIEEVEKSVADERARAQEAEETLTNNLENLGKGVSASIENAIDNNNTAIQNLIRGTSESSDSRNDPFKVLGYYVTYKELDDALKELKYDGEKYGHNYGYFRAKVLNHRQVEIKNLLISSGENHIVQVVSGCFKISNNALAADDNNYCIATRILKKQTASDENSTWGEWKVIVDSNSISSLETQIDDLSKGLNGSLEETSIDLNIGSVDFIYGQLDYNNNPTSCYTEPIKGVYEIKLNDDYKIYKIIEKEDGVYTAIDQICSEYTTKPNIEYIFNIRRTDNKDVDLNNVFKSVITNRFDKIEIDIEDINNELTDVGRLVSGTNSRVDSLFDDLRQEVLDRKAEDDKFKQGLFSVYPKMNIGALQEGAPPYINNTNQAYSDLITGNGNIILAEEFEITSYKYFENDAELVFDNNSKFDEFQTTGGLKLQIGVKRKDNGSFTNVNLDRIIQSCVFDKINIDNFSFSFDDYDCAGEYFISGNRKENTTDGLPSEIGAGNIEAKLTVFSKSKTKTDDEEACVAEFVAMQELTIVNTDTGYGSVYQRIKHNGVWSEWVDIKGGDIPLATKVTWDASSNMNDFKTPGVYDIYGERTRQDDNLPILNASSGHSIAGRLIVVASTLQPANNEICITQFLMLSNRLGGDGNMYIRTYNENNSPAPNWWTPWQKMQGVKEGYIFTDTMQVNPDGGVQEIEGVTGLNNMIDNGIYSGIYTDDPTFQAPTFIDTFTLIVINNYAVAGKDERLKRTISQLKYAVDAITNKATVKKRTKTDGDSAWGDWEDIGGGSGEVDVTDAVKQHGLPALVFQGFAKDGIVYSCKLKHDDVVGNMTIFDNGEKLSNFLLEKSGQSIGNVYLKIEYKSGMGSSGCIYIDIYMYGQYYKAVIDGSLFDRVRVSADMTTL